MTKGEKNIYMQHAVSSPWKILQAHAVVLQCAQCDRISAHKTEHRTWPLGLCGLGQGNSSANES